MKILSFDIEEWFIEKTYNNGKRELFAHYDSMLFRLLDLLDEHAIKATFFCLGSLIYDFSYVVKAISERGHEIGSHSLNHFWINKMSRKDFEEDTRKGIDLLEQCTGNKIESFRAPAFSIDESNKWAFEVLANCGIKNDASIFPASRDFGGFKEFKIKDRPSKIIFNNFEINEFPITLATLPVVGKDIAYSGGGYFRILPLSFVKKQMNQNDYVMCYFHIADLLDFKTKMMTKEEYENYFKEPGTLKNRYLRYLKSNVGRKRTFQGLESLLKSYNFISVKEASKLSTSFPEIKL